MIQNEYIIQLFNYYNLNIQIQNQKDNIFYTVYDIIPGKNTTISKIKRIIPDIATWLKCSVFLETRNGIQLKLEKENRNILYSYEFTKEISSGKRKEVLPLIIGQDENGNNLFYDLVKMPHLLIGGSTGSGKSVFVHNLILSLLYAGKSALILVDVKQVEFSIYEGIPQLATNVIYNSNDCIKMLKNVCSLMDERYNTLKSNNCRNIQEFHSINGKMQYLTIIIDELADIILQNPKIEKYITRIAQLGRAAGIHLILATQRPDHKILSGLIRANVPSRVCFAVQKATDSRIILDQSGGECLRGNGDGLFVPIGSRTAIRFQSPYTSTNTINKIIDILKKGR